MKILREAVRMEQIEQPSEWDCAWFGLCCADGFCCKGITP